MAAGGSSVKIASGASLSSVVDLTNVLLTGILMPAEWTSAAITFSASLDGSTYGDVYNADGDEYTISSANAVASRFITLDPRDFAGCRYLKVRSGTAAAGVNQGADRTLVLAITRGD